MRKKQHFGLIFLVCVIFVVGGLLLGSFVETATSPYIKINRGESSTKIRKVQLTINGLSDTKYMQVSNNPEFTDVDWEAYATRKNWVLNFGSGRQTVYARFKDAKGKVSNLYRDDITLSVPSSLSADFYINMQVDKDNKNKKTSASETDSRYASLDLEYSPGVEGYIVSNENIFSNLTFKPITSKVSWVLSPGEGKKTVYIQFLDGNGAKVTITKDIVYNQPEVYIPEGTLVKGQGSAIYYYGYDGRLHPFFSSGVYHSWYKDFTNIRFVSNAKLSQYRMGQSVCVRPGTWLLKFKGLPKVYAVLPGCQLQPILSEAEAYLIYGKNWTNRILELDLIEASVYKMLSYDVSDKDLKIVDRDRDGVDSEIEKEYSISDTNADSDGDGLTDLEEINYWFTDPKLKDTDGDGFGDMMELLNGYPPAGYGNLNTLLEDTYEYPAGSVIKKYTDGKLYYKHTNGYYYSIGKDGLSKLFKSNNFDTRFIIESPFKIDFLLTKGKGMSTNEEEVYYPTQLLAGDVVRL